MIAERQINNVEIMNINGAFERAQTEVVSQQNNI